MTDQHLDPDWLRRQLRLRNLVLRAMDNFAELFGRAEESLRERGAYYRRNRGEFSFGLENIDFLPQIGLPRTQKQTLEQAQRTFNIVRRDALALLGRSRAKSPGRCRRS